MKTWILSAIDTLFFKEARPMEAPGSSELGSVFPPPMRTITGAIRSHIGETRGDDWSTYKENTDLRNIIGYGKDDYANMTFKGVWIQYNDQRYYPAPLNLMAQADDNDHIKKLQFLEIGEACECDLGDAVRLVKLPDGMEGGKPLSQYWINAKGLNSVLAGKTPDSSDLIHQGQFFYEENRLGIARDNQKGVVLESMLYQTRHLRMNEKTAISIDIDGLDDHLKEGIIKLGGEGRMATLKSTKHMPAFPSQLSQTADTVGIILYLLSPMLLPQGSTFLPNFKLDKQSTNQSQWQGEINGIKLTLISSVIGKVHREGGWDMVEHKPIAVESLIPAGSVYYCEVAENTIEHALKTLNNTQIGEQQHLGRGHIAAGLWLASYNAKSEQNGKG